MKVRKIIQGRKWKDNDGATTKDMNCTNEIMYSGHHIASVELLWVLGVTGGEMVRRELTDAAST